MRLEGSNPEFQRGMFYAVLAYVKGYNGEDGYLVASMIRSKFREEGFSIDSGWFSAGEAIFKAVDKRFLLVGKEYNKLPVYRVKCNGELSLKALGSRRVFTVGNNLESMLVTVIDATGVLTVERVNLAKLSEGCDRVAFFGGDEPNSRELAGALKNKLGEVRSIYGDKEWELALARNAVTKEDCGMLAPAGLNTCLVGFNRCVTGVCRVLDRVDYITTSVDFMVDAGVLVLDLSRCTLLKGFIITGGKKHKNPVTIIFNDKFNYRVDSNIRVIDANVKFIGLRYVSELVARDSHIEGISEITFTAPRNSSSDSSCLSLCDCTGFDSLKVNVGDSVYHCESSIEISGIDAKELEIKMHAIPTDPENFKIERCAELEHLTIDGAGEWVLSMLLERIRLLPKLNTASFSFSWFYINYLGGVSSVIHSLSFGSTVLESLKIEAELVSNEYSVTPEIWCDSRIKLDLPSELRELITVKEFTEKEKFLLAFICGKTALKRKNDETVLALDDFREWDGFDDDGWGGVKGNLSLYPKYTIVDGEQALCIPKGIVSSVETYSVVGWKCGTGCRVYLEDERLDKEW